MKEETMLVAQEQLQFVRQLVAQFEQQSSAMVPLMALQAQYIAIVVTLRAIGHTFENVDCDSSERSRWSKEKWKTWQQEPIFARFIKPTRDVLLKEFRGGLTLQNEAFRSHAFCADPGMPDGVTVVSDLDVNKLTDGEGKLVIPKLREALDFWQSRLSEAEAAFEK
jgi:hypothetical protein